jgi:glycosyltransferase involved in cell wall biosynthesis
VSRILVLSNQYPPHGYGGYELACADAVNRWRQHGHDIAVLTSDHRRDGVDDEDADVVPVWRRLPLTWKQTPPPKRRRVQVEQRACRLLSDAVAEWRPDVVSVWNMAGLPFNLLHHLRGDAGVVAVLADNWPAAAPIEDPWYRMLRLHPRFGRAIATVARLPSRLPDLDALGVFVFVSESLRDGCRAGSPWEFPNSTIVPLGVSPSDFPPVEPVARPWRGRLLYVGRLDPTKGVDTAVRALGDLPPEVSLEIVGPREREHVDRLEALVHDIRAADRVRFGSAPRRALVKWYRNADVVVFPSEWDEPFGMVPLEAMASGAVVVATGTGGAGDYLVDGDNCVLFTPGDSAALAAAIRRVAADADLRQRLVEGGLRTAATYTIDRTSDRLEAIHDAAAPRQSSTVR